MNYNRDEPYSPGPLPPRPRSTPHSAPVEWLQAHPDSSPEPEVEEGRAASAAESTPSPASLTDADLTELAARLRGDPQALAEFIELVSPDQQRRDGWSPFARKLFLQVLAETGKVTLACACTGLSRQSAYSLAARDPLFAAGWDAAAMLVRRPLTDMMHEQCVDGITETVTRSDGAVATRHRYDTRLTIAVLNRLDRRCERAEERGDRHLALIRHWDEWLGHIGRGDEAAARAILESGSNETAQLRQPCQLPESENPAPLPPGYDPEENCWRKKDGGWMTVYPPPAGFDGYESCRYDGLVYYERSCTADESALLDAREAAKAAAEQAELEAEEAEILADSQAERDAWFDKIRRELAANGHAGLDAANALPCPTERQADSGSGG